MPGWFVQLAIVAAVGLFGCYNTDFVTNSIMFTNGLMIPVWILAVNLWWITLILAPFAYLSRRGHPVKWLVATSLIAVALYVLPILYIAQERLAVVPTPVNSADLMPLPEAGIGSLEMVLSDNRSDLHGCQTLCQQLLIGGNIQWMRMASAPDARLLQRSIVYYRAAPAECLAMDNRFPPDGICLLARPDDGAKADLQLHLTELGDFWSPMDQRPGLVALTGIQKASFTDLRDGRLLIDQSRYGWTEPMVGFLEPDTQITTVVTANGGFRPRPNRLYVGKVDLAADFEQIGVRLNLPRSSAPYDSPRKRIDDHGPYTTQEPYDAVLRSSMFAVAQGKPVPEGSAVERLIQNMPGLVNKPPIVAVVLAAPTHAVKSKHFQPNAKTGLPIKAEPLAPHNHYPADDDLGGWLEQISGQGLDAFRAMQIVGDMVSDAPPGTYDANGDAYLAALETAPGLTPLLGNFGFDPTPHLRALWTAGADQAGDQLVLQAACHADDRWAASLAPFVLETGQTLIPRFHDPKFFGDALHQAELVLLHLNRADLAQALVDQIDWDIVDGLDEMARFGTFPPVTRNMLQASINHPTPCRD